MSQKESKFVAEQILELKRYEPQKDNISYVRVSSGVKREIIKVAKAHDLSSVMLIRLILQDFLKLSSEERKMRLLNSYKNILKYLCGTIHESVNSK